ncbi:MAG: spore coat U domain-containing protein [Luteibacter sp.]|uniref:Csu type fimbrial protein n=1 Tax=Luteibacter sp. TaxID=1886636 RepID=UPI002808593D|nr:spore coat U domain-containing protein [Luteibacter sp.]MDQ7996578.1 spore coat U domain-containing protein [Luteibacter sp.]MDQ8048443.1 spore coat U domain-containing protein [Luteibacter sp.]
MKWFVLILLAIAAMAATPRVEAATTCSITSITNLAFGTVDPTGTVVNTQATVNYSCSYSGVLGGLYGSYISACVSLAPDELGNFAPRTLLNTANTDRMQYQAFKDGSYSTIWGRVNNATYTPQTFTRNFGLLSNNVTITGSLTIYGQVPALQSGLSPGNYSGTLAGSLTGTSITWSYNEVLLTLGTFPASCTSGGTVAAQTVAGPALTATANVAAKCTVGTATELNFGSVSGLLRVNTDQTSLVRATCTQRAAYQIGLDNGKNASGTTRRMTDGTHFVTYQLFTDPGRTTRWGNTLNTDTAAGTGSGSEQTLTVYGRVPIQPAQPAGSYSDIVTVTVTY